MLRCSMCEIRAPYILYAIASIYYIYSPHKHNQSPVLCVVGVHVGSCDASRIIWRTRTRRRVHASSHGLPSTCAGHVEMPFHRYSQYGTRWFGGGLRWRQRCSERLRPWMSGVHERRRMCARAFAAGVACARRVFEGLFHRFGSSCTCWRDSCPRGGGGRWQQQQQRLQNAMN